MPLESCMLVLDNSEYMRNGDFIPTRFQAQSQAVSTIFTTKTDSNPESAVGLMTMAGKTCVPVSPAPSTLLPPPSALLPESQLIPPSPSLLVTPTNDIGKLLSALGRSTIGGTSDLLTSVQIAQLALKHRENKNQRQRIVVFVGSPLEDSQDSLVKLGKRLRKNNVLVDVVTLGEEGNGNDEKLRAMVDAAGAGESHLVSVPPNNVMLLSDIVLGSPILFDPNRPEPELGGEGEDGLDPSMDPELAMAIRMSLQEAAEASARNQPGESSTSTSANPDPVPDQATTTAAVLPESVTNPLHNANDPDVPTAPGDSGGIPTPAPAAVSSEIAGGNEEMDEDEMLRQAMELSRGIDPGEDVVMAEQGEGDEEEDEEAAIARAIAMSLEEGKGEENKEKQ